MTMNKQLEHKDHQRSDTRYPVCLLAHDVDTPFNVGGFFRMADALGVEKIYLSGSSIAPPNDKLRKTSRSAEKYVDYEYSENPLDIIRRVKAAGYTVASLELTTCSVDLADYYITADDKICLVLGAESVGVSAELLAVSDVTVHIPMLGANSSMNVGSACSIAVYELTRKMRAFR